VKALLKMNMNDTQFETNTYNPFNPPRYLRNSDVQTFFGSSKLRLWRTGSINTHARDIIITTDAGVRLTGAITKTAHSQTKGLAILLHGWEGSMASTYVVTSGQYFLDRGFDVFRLNLRDHGPSHHLNQGLFYATLLDEVCSAISRAAAMFTSRPAFLCGFSLGGNFVLRAARKWSQNGAKTPRFRHFFAISPVLDPSAATDAIDRHPVIQYYFLRKWKRSLRKKQDCFPRHYHFEHIIALPTVRRITDQLLQDYSNYDHAEDYFADYNIAGNALHSVTVPTTIITAADDPIIPATDFDQLPDNPCLRVIVHQYGGHNGFIDHWRGYTWYERYIHQVFLKAE
jgi:predicted alpha/beta-fold hydrolase